MGLHKFRGWSTEEVAICLVQSTTRIKLEKSLNKVLLFFFLASVWFLLVILWGFTISETSKTFAPKPSKWWLLFQVVSATLCDFAWQLLCPFQLMASATIPITARIGFQVLASSLAIWICHWYILVISYRYIYIYTYTYTYTYNIYIYIL